MDLGIVSLTLGNSPLPFAHRRLGDEEAVGEFLLGQAHALSAAADIRAEGLFIFHLMSHPLSQQLVFAPGASPP